MSLGLIVLTLLPFVVTPGASFTITVSAAADGDRRASLRVWGGTALGIALIAGAAALSGIGDYVESSQTARTVFGLLSGAVLLGLAVGAGRRVRAVLVADITETRPQQRLVLWAFVALVTNVKALSLYALVLPAALVPGAAGLAAYACSAAVHIVMLLVWLSVVGALVRRTPALRAGAGTRCPLRRRCLRSRHARSAQHPRRDVSTTVPVGARSPRRRTARGSISRQLVFRETGSDSARRLA